MRRDRIIGGVAAGSLLVSLAACTRTEPPAGSDPVARGQSLYSRLCIGCHGERGDGDGPAARSLPRRPRSFLGGDFRTAPRPGAIPSDDVLLGVIADGLPDGAMPSFAWLPPESQRALLAYLKTFLARRTR